MRAPYFVDDTYGHCIWSENTIWSLDFRISSSRSPHTFLEDSGFSSPPRLKSRCSHLSCVNFSIFRRCAFSGRRCSTRLRGTYGDFVKSQDHICWPTLSKVLIGVGFACVRLQRWEYRVKQTYAMIIWSLTHPYNSVFCWWHNQLTNQTSQLVLHHWGA